MNERGPATALQKMRDAGLSLAACTSFERAWHQAASGHAGLIPENSLAAADGMALERVRGLEGVYVAQVGGEHFHSTRQAQACRPRRRRPRHRRCW